MTLFYTGSSTACKQQTEFHNLSVCLSEQYTQYSEFVHMMNVLKWLDFVPLATSVTLK